jgi:hypothetical protein
MPCTLAPRAGCRSSKHSIYTQPYSDHFTTQLALAHAGNLGLAEALFCVLQQHCVPYAKCQLTSFPWGNDDYGGGAATTLINPRIAITAGNAHTVSDVDATLCCKCTASMR